MTQTYWYKNYALQVGTEGPVKIGFTELSGQVRMTHLQVMSPWKLRLIADWPGDKDTEAALQRELAAFRIRGEWFHPTPAVFAAIDAAIALSRIDARDQWEAEHVREAAE